MLGGGNPVSGSNPAGVGQTLNYIGKHVYANSGTIAAATTSTSALKFTTGSTYIVAKIQFNGYTDLNEANDGKRGICGVVVNGEQIANLLTDYDTGNMMETSNIEVILPPHTDVDIKVEANGSDAGFFGFVVLVGETYA